MTKVINTLTQDDFHGAFQKLLEQYKCIAAGGDYFEGDLVATPHKAPTIRPPASHHENYPS